MMIGVRLTYLIVSATLMALWILLFFVYRRRRARRANWPSCSGRIEYAKVTTVAYTIQGQRQLSQKLILDYYYNIGGTTHRGTGTGSSYPPLPSKYPAGAPVTIAYHPSKPGISVIKDPDFERLSDSAAALVLSLVALVIGMIIFGLYVFINPDQPLSSALAGGG